MNEKSVLIRFCWILFLSLPGNFISGQEASCSIQGKVLDSESGETLFGASVFIPYSTIGVTSDLSGQFVIDGLDCSYQQVSVSYLGYESQSAWLEPNSSQKEFKLKPISTELTTAEIQANAGRKRKRWLRKFEQGILGSTANASLCRLLNPEALLFEENGKILSAQATDLLRFENNALGYEVLFLLESFTLKEGEINYAGKPFFKPMETASKSQAARWEKSRELAYHGSLAHFLVSLRLDGGAEKAGYRMFYAKEKSGGGVELLGNAKSEDLFNKASSAFYNLTLDGILYVEYILEKEKMESGSIGEGARNLGQDAEQEMIQKEYNDLQNFDANQISYLFARRSAVPFDSDGFVQQPGWLEEFGYWSTEGLADLLPRNFSALKTENPVQGSPEKKGFVLSNLLLPLGELKDGGPPKDGIPAIDDPVFTDGTELNSEELVLAIYFEGIARAYPIRILNYHEIVNDEIADHPIAITYCPLCRSGIAFRRIVEGQIFDFGVSGLLYNSDVLLYDRQTESLWSQLLGKSVSGKMSGKDLETVPLFIMSWGEWKKQYPNTEALSDKTGYIRDYMRDPYFTYPQNDELYFPVAAENERIERKALVLGLQIGNEFKAYPMEKLGLNVIWPLKDKINGTQILIYFNSVDQSAWVTDEQGEVLTTSILYWFAWYAFHPQTNIW